MLLVEFRELRQYECVLLFASGLSVIVRGRDIHMYRHERPSYFELNKLAFPAISFKNDVTRDGYPICPIRLLQFLCFSHTVANILANVKL